MLACVLVIGEGFLEAVWKEADSSAPLAQWLWARALPPSSAIPSVVWDSPGTRPVGGEPCGGLASSRCLISDLVLLPQVRSQGGKEGRGNAGCVVEIIVGLEPGRPGSVSWFCHQPAECAHIHSSASPSLRFLGKFSSLPAGVVGRLGQGLRAKPLVLCLPHSQVPLNGGHVATSAVIVLEVPAMEAGSSQASAHRADHPKGTTVKGWPPY